MNLKNNKLITLFIILLLFFIHRQKDTFQMSSCFQLKLAATVPPYVTVTANVTVLLHPQCCNCTSRAL